MNDRSKIKHLAESAVLLGNDSGVNVSVSPFVLIGATADSRVAHLTAVDVQKDNAAELIEKFCSTLSSDLLGESRLYTICAMFCHVSYLCSRPGAPFFRDTISGKKGIQRFIERNKSTTPKAA